MVRVVGGRRRLVREVLKGRTEVKGRKKGVRWREMWREERGR